MCFTWNTPWPKKILTKALNATRRQRSVCSAVQHSLPSCFLKKRRLIYLRPIARSVLHVCPLSSLRRQPYAHPTHSFLSPPLFSFPLRLCLLATPSSCWLRQDASPAPRKIKQTPTTSDKLKTHPPITAPVHHSEPTHKTKTEMEKKHQIPFFFPGLFFSVIVFCESLWLPPSHSFLARGYPTAARWLRNLKHFFPWAGRASLERKGGAGLREKMFTASCCGTTGAKRTELVTAPSKGCFFFPPI